MESEFEQIKRVAHLPTRIASEFGKRIYDGTLKAGDKLPTEHALSKSFGVSRTVVREAIAQLKSEGLVETRQGVGAFVMERPARQIRLEDGKSMDRNDFHDLYQLRFPLEMEAAALSAVHHSPKHMEAMTAALARICATEDWGSSGVAADLDFHHIIAESTGNDYFTQFIGAISDRISHVIVIARTEGQLEDVISRTVEEHTAIRDAISTRDPAMARAAMRRHLIGSAQRIGIRLDFYS
ncbi:FadR/GntR family transcriptional regulator [Pseudoruegeria sp. SK021]|uniref:FadR/GntR family transcriptional regulator n=1 Tax=Pseudoruegeria sp. SK021 TaxID=1933035 RepID=UPI000A22807B|nr:FadR/GntR family transcriptional regulator [Pseudoruegeria sp. SK021]OSP54824.1 GntR family transcriptional regulator [Pseudoruegeria sp. SK021]